MTIKRSKDCTDNGGSSGDDETTSTTTVATESTSSSSEGSDWKVIRLAATSKEQRKKLNRNNNKCPQRKNSCSSLKVMEDGVEGQAKNHSWFGGSTYSIRDYNHYRTQGHAGKFKAGTKDRAVSIATVAAYEILQKAMGHEHKIQYGDLGENILIEGPPAVAAASGDGDSQGLYVGAKIRVGTALLELTEANNPCFRFNTQKWAPEAKKLWGGTAPKGNANKWFHSPQCPLNHNIHPGVRGWLAKVLEEGQVVHGDSVKLAAEEKDFMMKKKGQPAKKVEAMEAGEEDHDALSSPPPAKKQKQHHQDEYQSDSTPLLVRKD